jgi:isopentenyldiphosphate isomerase
VTDEPREEELNVYDTEANVVGARRRREAKASGLAVGAVNVLLVNDRGEVLLQRRPGDKENGGHWDKSVGGHVGAGEEFDTTAVRETGEELFDEAGSGRVHLASSEDEYRRLLDGLELSLCVVFRRVGFQKNLRDVRHAPDRAGVRNVLYHVAIYAGRTAIPRGAFRPQASEIADLGYFEPAAVDHMLLAGELAPNMAFLWLSYGHLVLGGGPEARR